MSCLAPAAPSLSALLALVPEQLPEIYAWRDDLEPIAAQRKGRQAALESVAQRRGIPAKTVRKRFDAFVRDGLAGLINRRACPQLWSAKKPAGLSTADQELVKQWCEAFQRKSEPALRALLRAWREHRLSAELQGRGLSVPVTETPLDPLLGYPRGWSLRNLQRYAPSEYELKAARIGRSAAKAHLPLVYRTRRDLYVGQFFLWDDMWHDHEVVDLDQKKRGRPLEFHGLDLKSAHKFIWGNRTRVEAEFKHEGLKASDFRFVLAAGLTSTGYHATRGTTLVVENATAAIPDEIARMLYDTTGGMIHVYAGGMEGAAAHAGQYAGRPKGNFRVKAALESCGNLYHNELAALPGQVGMDRQHCPEEMHDGGRLVDPKTGAGLSRYGRLKHVDALLAALTQLPPEQAQWLRWDVCTIQQFRMVLEQVYGRINRRTEHELEGWDDYYVPSPLGHMRRLSPFEVFQPGRRALSPISLETTALLLGAESGTERTVIGNKIVVHDGEISGDELRYDAVGLLPDREKFLTVVNPIDPSRLFCFDSRQRFVAALPRLHSVSHDDVEAIQRDCGEAAKREPALLQPLRRRHMAEARERAARARHNAEVLSGAPLTPEAKAEARAVAQHEQSAIRLGAAVREQAAAAPTPADDTPAEVWAAQIPEDQTPEEKW